MRRNQMLGTLGAMSLAGASAAAAIPAAAIVPPLNHLTPPQGRKIRAAMVVGDYSNLIDFAGPSEVFQDTWTGHPDERDDRPFLDGPNMAFEVYLVSDTVAPFKAGPLTTFVPNFTFDNAPRPDVVVVGAQASPTARTLEWLRAQAKTADVTMSVCTGAFVLAKAGLLDGLLATTHHSFYDVFAAAYPKVKLVRNVRYVENAKISCSSGLTSGIDLAFHVVARYFGEAVANQTASWMEYQRTAEPT